MLMRFILHIVEEPTLFHQKYQSMAKLGVDSVREMGCILPFLRLALTRKVVLQNQRRQGPHQRKQNAREYAGF
jgi:hypothetical protein